MEEQPNTSKHRYFFHPDTIDKDSDTSVVANLIIRSLTSWMMTIIVTMCALEVFRAIWTNSGEISFPKIIETLMPMLVWLIVVFYIILFFRRKADAMLKLAVETEIQKDTLGMALYFDEQKHIKGQRNRKFTRQRIEFREPVESTQQSIETDEESIDAE